MNIPLGLVIASLIFVSNWKLEDGWKGIKVFETSRKEVEKRLGKPSEEDSGEVRYETDEALFLVLYSGEPCRQPYTPPTDYVIKTSVLVEGFNVQKNTVLQYSVIPKKELRLNDFEWDRKLYDRFESLIYAQSSVMGILKMAFVLRRM